MVDLTMAIAASESVTSCWTYATYPSILHEKFGFADEVVVFIYIFLFLLIIIKRIRFIFISSKINSLILRNL